MADGDCSRPTLFPSKNRAEGYFSVAHLRTPEVEQKRKAGRVVLFAMNGRDGHRCVFVADSLHNRLRFGESHVPVSELTRIRELIQHLDKLVMQAGTLYSLTVGGPGERRPFEVLKELPHSQKEAHQSRRSSR